MRTAPLVVLCLAVAASCRCDERPNLVPPAPITRRLAPGTDPVAGSAVRREPFDSAASGSSAQDGLRAADEASRSRGAATPDATTAGAPPSAPAPRPLPLASAVAVVPSGPSALSASAENVVDPASTFRIDVPVALAEVRVVLLDAGGDHVPATSTREVSDTTRFDLAPAKPLVPASRYVLRVEGASGSDVRGADGTAYAPATIGLVAAGSPPPREPPRKKRRR